MKITKWACCFNVSAILAFAGFMNSCGQGKQPAIRDQQTADVSENSTSTDETVSEFKNVLTKNALGPTTEVPSGCIGPMQTICTGVVVDTGGGCDAAPGINSCLNAENVNLALPPGNYLIRSMIQIQHSGVTLSTLGLSSDTTTCMQDSNSKQCAVIRADNTFCENAMLWIGNAKTPVDRVTIDHIALDGALEARSVNGNATCRSKGRGRNLVELGGANNTLRYSASVNAVGGTGVGWAVAKTGTRSTIHRNYIANNGRGVPDTKFWSDGLTVGKVSNSNITGNLFVDNTDVDFIIGGATNTRFYGNKITHSKKRSFAAFMMTNWSNRNKPETAQWADFRRFDIANNVFDCNSKVDVCVQIGIFPWFYDLTNWARFRTMGGSFHNNRISTQLQGVNVGGGGTRNYPFVMFDNVIDAGSTPSEIGFSNRQVRSIGKLNIHMRGSENFVTFRKNQIADMDNTDAWHSIF